MLNKEADFANTAGAVIEDDTSSADKLPIVNLTVQQQLVKIAVLAVDVSEDVQILVASFERECDTERVGVRSSKEAVLRNVVEGCALLQDCLLVVNENMHIIFLI